MEKVRDILGMLKKHHFWILSVAATIVIVGCWYTAKAALTSQFDQGSKEITSSFEGLTAIKSNTFHPNESYKAGVDKLREEWKLRTDKQWELLYDRQKQVFVWPLEDFQAWDEAGRKTPMDAKMLNLYRDYVDRAFPQLEQLVEMRRIKGGEGGNAALTPMPYPGALGAAGQMVEYEGMVDWDATDNAKLRERLMTWGKTQPNQIEVLICHENLAIYRSLLAAIRATNAADNATDNDNAVVKRIQMLDIGADASMPGMMDSQGNIIMPAEFDPANAGQGGAGASPYAQMSSSGPVQPSDGSMMPDKETMLLQDRYLDGSGKPVPADAIKNNTPPFAEFKLMKIRLLLTVDQRKIPLLLAQLANADLSVEVHQVRINPQKMEIVSTTRQNALSSLGVGGAYPGGAGGFAGRAEGVPSGPVLRRGGDGPMSGSPYGPGAGRSPYGPMGSPYGPGRMPRGGDGPMARSPYSNMGMTPQSTESPNDATVEIKGIVYIYNPVDPTKTGTGTDTTEASTRSVFGFAAASSAAPTMTAEAAR